MKALCWHGKDDIRYDTVPDPQIEHPRDAIIKMTLLRDLRLGPALLRRLHAGHEIGRHRRPRVHGRGGRGRRREQASSRSATASSCRSRSAAASASSAGAATGRCASAPTARRTSATSTFGHTTAGLFGYTHLTGGYAGGQAEYVRVPYADVAPVKIPDGLTDEQVLFLGDIFPTGWQAAAQCDIQPTDTVAVWGAGPVGQFAIRSAVHARRRAGGRDRQRPRAARHGARRRRDHDRLRRGERPRAAAGADRAARAPTSASTRSAWKRTRCARSTR